MANKTQPSSNDVKSYINEITDQKRRQDIQALVSLIQDISMHPPVMWGSSIIGFGSYHYKYDSGREGDSPQVALSSRVQAITIYGLHLYETTKNNNDLLSKLGSYKTGKGCLYIRSLSDIDINVLKQMISNSFAGEA